MLLILSQSVNQGSGNKSEGKSGTKEGGEKPKFGPQPTSRIQTSISRMSSRDFLSLSNLGEVEMSREQQVRFLELIYDNQAVFSLCNEDLGLCDCLKHTIPTTTDKPMYLPHWTILVQLQAEVHKCLDAWLRQGIIWPSHSPYASQVVIMFIRSLGKFICVLISGHSML